MEPDPDLCPKVHLLVFALPTAAISIDSPMCLLHSFPSLLAPVPPMTLKAPGAEAVTRSLCIQQDNPELNEQGWLVWTWTWSLTVPGLCVVGHPLAEKKRQTQGVQHPLSRISVYLEGIEQRGHYLLTCSFTYGTVLSGCLLSHPVY